MLCFSKYVSQNIYVVGEVRSLVQTPLGDEKKWKCVADFFSGEQKEIELPSRGIKLRLSKEEAKEGVRNLKPQRYTGK